MSSRRPWNFSVFTLECHYIHYVNVSVLMKFSRKPVLLPYLSQVLHKIIGFGCVLESPR